MDDKLEWIYFSDKDERRLYTNLTSDYVIVRPVENYFSSIEVQLRLNLFQIKSLV